MKYPGDIVAPTRLEENTLASEGFQSYRGAVQSPGEGNLGYTVGVEPRLALAHPSPQAHHLLRPIISSGPSSPQAHHLLRTITSSDMALCDVVHDFQGCATASQAQKDEERKYNFRLSTFLSIHS